MQDDDNNSRAHAAPRAAEVVRTDADLSAGPAARTGSRRPAHGRPFTTESARQAAFRRHEKERERKAETEKAEAWDALTVSGHFAKSLAREATEEELAAVVRALIAAAKQGKTYAAKVLGEWVTKVLPQDEDEVPEEVEWDQLTPAQKAAYRARIDAALAALEAQDEDLPA